MGRPRKEIVLDPLSVPVADVLSSELIHRLEEKGHRLPRNLHVSISGKNCWGYCTVCSLSIRAPHDDSPTGSMLTKGCHGLNGYNRRFG